MEEVMEVKLPVIAEAVTTLLYVSPGDAEYPSADITTILPDKDAVFSTWIES
jgi:hypothetical protein